MSLDRSIIAFLRVFAVDELWLSRNMFFIKQISSI